MGTVLKQATGQFQLFFYLAASKSGSSAIARFPRLLGFGNFAGSELTGVFANVSRR
jgi:hypothetical protein